MRPLHYIVREQSPLTLARELLWRTKKAWSKHQLRERLRLPPCAVQFQPVRYYAPEVSLCSEEARRLIIGVADRTTQGDIPLLSYDTSALEKPIRWNMDFVSGRSWPESASESLIITRHDGSDVKVPWELSRLQVLPILGKAFVLTGRTQYRDAAKNLILDWISRNPIGVGINWTIAMEAALRGLSICLYLDLMVSHMDPELLATVNRSLWEHLLFIEANLEFSHIVRSNHYLSNLLGLYALSVFLRGAGMDERRSRYRRLLQQEISTQVYSDGGNREASTGYQVLTTQMFTCGALLMKAEGARLDDGFLTRLARMHRYLRKLADSRGRLPHIGDCDDGRVELLFDDLHQILDVPPQKRNSLQISSLLQLGAFLFNGESDRTADERAWYGEAKSFNRKRASEEGPNGNGLDLFPNAGVAVARLGDAHLCFSAISNGLGGRGSHTHNDKLGFVLSLNGNEIFSDSGTGCYTRDRKLRDRFRATCAHNTVVVDCLEQNTIPKEVNGTFCLGNEARVSKISARETAAEIELRASHQGYSRCGVEHERLLRLRIRSLLIEDKFTGLGHHRFSLYFQVPARWRIVVNEDRKEIQLQGPDSLCITWGRTRPTRLEATDSSISQCYGVIQESGRIRAEFEGKVPLVVQTEMHW